MRYLAVIITYVLCCPLWAQEPIPVLFSARKGLVRGGIVGAWNLGSVNLLKWSEDFGNAAWLSDDPVVVASNGTTDPLGATTADLVKAKAAYGPQDVYQSVSISSSSAVLSVYAKAAGYNWIKMLLSSGKTANFNIQSGAVGTVEAGATASIVNAGGGWYRCSVSSAITPGSNLFILYVRDVDNGGAFSGDGTSGVYLWGAQVSEGPTALSYQATTDLQAVPNLVPGGPSLQLGSTSSADTNDPVRRLSGMVFDGTDDYLVSSTTIPIAAGGLSVMGVAARAWETGAYNALFGGSAYSATAGIFVGTSAASLNDWLAKELMIFGDGSSTGRAPKSANSYGSITSGTYHVIGGVVSDNKSVVILDGVESARLSLTSSVKATNVAIYIGSSSATTDRWNGTISHVLLYNRALSPKEVRQNHNTYFKPSMAAVGVTLP